MAEEYLHRSMDHTWVRAPGTATMLLRIESATAAYTGEPVLKDITLTLMAGEILAVAGPNGSGKSSLLKLALGTLRPRTGKVIWFDRPLWRWPRRDLARRTAYLPQAPTSLPGQSVGDVLATGRAPYWGAFGVESARDREAAAAAADLLGVREWLSRDIETLSGGQRQRVFIARCVAQTLGGASDSEAPTALRGMMAEASASATATTPASRGDAAEGAGAILLDEPDTFLDLKHIAELSATLRMLAHERGMGILLASHDLNLAAGVADRMILLREGSMAAAGAPAEVMQAEIIESAYGVPVSVIEADGRRFLVPAS